MRPHPSLSLIALVLAVATCSPGARAEDDAFERRLLADFESASSPYEQFDICRLLAGTTDPFILGRLEHAMETSCGKWRNNAAFVLAAGGDQRALDLLFRQVWAEDVSCERHQRTRATLPRGSYYAAHLLALVKAPGVVERLEELLLSGERQVPRGKVAWSLGEQGDPPATPALRESTESGGDSAPAGAGARLKLGDRSALPILAEELAEGHVQAAWALGERGGDEAVPVLVAALAQESEPVRQRALLALSWGRSADARRAFQRSWIERGTVDGSGGTDCDSARLLAARLPTRSWLGVSQVP